MPASPVFDVAIGLVFFYSALSLLCSAIQERISAALGLRARGLEQWVTKNLGADGARRFYGHPLIAALGGTRASYVSSQTFAMALFDTCGVTPQPPSTGAPADPLRQQAIADDIRQTLSNLPNVPAGAALLAHFDHAQGRMSDVRATVESWFDDAMQRVSGGYRRRIHVYLMAIALFLALALNADTLRVAGVLYRDPVVRAAFAERARTTVGAEQARVSDEDVRTLVAGLPLPIGWSGDAPPSDAAPLWYGAKGLGLLLTVAAVSLGGPFWFDVLNRFVNVRAAGGKPALASGAAPTS